MPSDFVKRDYPNLVPLVMEKLFPVAAERERIWSVLDRYQSKEPDRVRLGILKAAKGEPGEIERLAELAATDFRDLLCIAEYPLSSRRWALRDSDPDKYDALQEREQRMYDRWIERVLAR